MTTMKTKASLRSVINLYMLSNGMHNAIEEVAERFITKDVKQLDQQPWRRENSSLIFGKLNFSLKTKHISQCIRSDRISLHIMHTCINDALHQTMQLCHWDIKSIYSFYYTCLAYTGMASILLVTKNILICDPLFACFVRITAALWYMYIPAVICGNNIRLSEMRFLKPRACLARSVHYTGIHV